jgi:hypothetical protein
MTGLPKKTCTLEKTEPPIVDCRPQLTSRIALLKSRGYSIFASKDPCKKKPRSLKRKRPNDEDELGNKKKGLPPWSSEYRDAINKTGDYILKEMRLSSKYKLIREKMKLFKLNECEDDKN